MSSTASFKTEFAVELHCEACVKTVKAALAAQDGVESYEISLQDQRVSVEGHCSPSQIARALKKDGRQVIVRGTSASSSASDEDGAAVCIFEAYTPHEATRQQQSIHGLARMVGSTTILDLTMKHEQWAKAAQQQGKSSFDVQTTTSSALATVNGSNSNGQTSGVATDTDTVPTKYGVFIAKTGDISDGAASTGGVLRELGQLELRRRDGYGDLFTEFQNLNIWDNIGRAMVIAPVLEGQTNDKAAAAKLGPGILAGVIARSAGAWNNDKSVCTCSGKTVWEEARTAKF